MFANSTTRALATPIEKACAESVSAVSTGLLACFQMSLAFVTRLAAFLPPFPAHKDIVSKGGIALTLPLVILNPVRDDLRNIP